MRVLGVARGAHRRTFALADGHTPILSEFVSLTKAVDIQTDPVPNFIHTVVSKLKRPLFVASEMSGFG
jgi:hypothetical protein